MRYSTSIAVVGALLVSASLATAAPKKTAAKHFGDGLSLYSDKKYAEAAVELEMSYNLKNDQTTLFAWAQAERLDGNCDRSKELLTNYIAKGANAKQSKAAYELMEQCTPRVVEAAPPVVVPPLATGDTTSTDGTTSTGDTSTGDTTSTGGTEDLGTGASVAASQSDNTKHWYKDWVGITLLGVSGVSATLGILNYTDARKSEKDAVKDGVSYDRFLQLRSEAEDGRTNAVILGIGSAVILGGAAVYILTDLVSGTSSDEESASEGIGMQLDGSGGGSVSWAGSF